MSNNFAPVVLSFLVVIGTFGCTKFQRQNSAENQFREIANKSIKEASTYANQYAECVMLSTLAYRSSSAQPSDIADAIQSKCQNKLDGYEMWLATYYSATTDRGRVDAQNERARRSKEELRQRIRRQAISSIIDDRMIK